MKNELIIGDTVFSSPMGPGVITGITDSGYPQVDHVTVACLVHKTEDGKFLVFDRSSFYANGDWEMFLDDERVPGKDVSQAVVVVRSSEEAINFCKAVKSLPKNIMFDHDLGGDDTSMKFVTWMILHHLSPQPDFKLREDFKFSVHSQNPVGAQNIKAAMDKLIHEQLGK